VIGLRLRHLIRKGSLPFSALNTVGNRLNHADVPSVIAHTDIDGITVEPVLQGEEGDGQELIN
jgi:hypothetical protein